VPRPVLFLISDDGGVLDRLAADLRRRFDADYRVVGSSAPTALAMLADLAARSDEVALLIADERIVEPAAVELLDRAHALHQGAKRVLLINRGNWSATHPAVRAMAVGKIDYHLYNPWRPVERILYLAVAEFLAMWDKDNEPPPGGLRVVGPRWSVRSHDLRDVLMRVGIPYWFYDEDSETGRQMLAAAGMEAVGRPVVVLFDGSALVDPSHAELMTRLGMRTRPDADSYDVAIIGAGPAGLAAAVYAASEGLHTVVLEPAVPGGQAGTSSMIRNYLGFHRGVSGDELTARALDQAWLFGAEFVLASAATGLRRLGLKRLVRTADGTEITARTVIIATGVIWRRLGVAPLEALVGAGVFYGAAGAEGWAQEGRDVFVVGAGNSAGQAALYLARWAASVTILVRGAKLAATMSTYLATEVEKTPNISVRLRTEVVDGRGGRYLESITLRERESGATEVVAAGALFLMIGAEPRTDWLGDGVQRCGKGFLLTGRDVVRGGVPETAWPLARQPLLLETSVPGVFAAGDVRHRSVKRVASAVGEGATAVHLVHEYLSAPA
jgi:thioredoxin reductase (NADPH)